MKKIKNFCCFILSSMVCLSLTCTTVSATCNMTNYQTDNTSGWTLKSAHRGTVVSDYKYINNEIKNRYSSDINAAKSMWGSHIYMDETSTSGYGTITVTNDQSSSAYAVTTTIGADHINDNFTITINQANYDSASNTIKKIVLAHEIGHVYGLGHYSDITKIMNPSAVSTMSISASEFAAIDACSHSHTHTSFSYELYSGSKHKARCSYCKAYILQSHSLNSNGVCTKCGYPKRSTISIYDYEDYNEQNNDNMPEVEPKFEDEITNSYNIPFVYDEN